MRGERFRPTQSAPLRDFRKSPNSPLDSTRILWVSYAISKCRSCQTCTATFKEERAMPIRPVRFARNISLIGLVLGILSASTVVGQVYGRQPAAEAVPAQPGSFCRWQRLALGRCPEPADGLANANPGAASPGGVQRAEYRRTLPAAATPERRRHRCRIRRLPSSPRSPTAAPRWSPCRTRSTLARPRSKSPVFMALPPARAPAMTWKKPGENPRIPASSTAA